ncbi:hypothetical protein GCM10010470_32730 [Saccharopolyspora taberi]|uniref:Uncharacterized protein n=1 Tax=Saccharopolyspora taberi TaxID=60895 RepID=A0ABN3VFE4_9PSEU
MLVEARQLADDLAADSDRQQGQISLGGRRGHFDAAVQQHEDVGGSLTLVEENMAGLELAQCAQIQQSRARGGREAGKKTAGRPPDLLASLSTHGSPLSVPDDVCKES